MDAEYSYGGGFSGDLGLGYDFGAIRTELSYAYNNDAPGTLNSSLGNVPLSGGSTSLNSAYLSAYWDIPLGGGFVPYIGGGAGYTNYSFGAGSLAGVGYGGSNVGTFGYQAKAGLAYTLTRQSDLYLEAVYQGGSSFSINGEKYGALNSWGPRLGLRWRFGGAPAAAVVMAPEPAPAPAPLPLPAPEPAPAPVRGLW